MSDNEGGEQGGLQFKIHGMDCGEEVAALRREIGPLVGGESNLAFDVLAGRMWVTCSVPGLSETAIVQAVERTGMRAEAWRPQAQQSGTGTESARGWKSIATAASGSFLLAGFVSHVAVAGVSGALGLTDGVSESGVPPLAVAFYLISTSLGAWFILPKAVLAVRRMRPDMNLLMTVAVIGAAAIGEWLEAATVSFLFAVSLALEAWSVGRARKAIAALLALTPKTVTLIGKGGVEQAVSPEQVPVGGQFVVRPGERIGLDGIVRRGESLVNQGPITGESAPVAKAIGAQVFAGSINGDGVLELESTSLASDTVVARIVRMVSESGARRSPAEQWVDRFARVYTPAVMLLAILVLLVPPLLLGGEWSEWLYRSLVLLVIGCPCALVISTPVSVVSALAAAARHGVLIKGGAYLEAPGRLRAVALDKTGTLTRGKPSVATVVPMNGHDELEVITRAAAIEVRSSHPIAEAIVSYAGMCGLTYTPAQDVVAVQGKGASGTINGKMYWLGSHRYADERGQGEPQLCARLDAMAADGWTVVVVGTAEHICGLIGMRDSVRPGTKGVLDELRQLGVERIAMLTGDNKGTASVVATEAGVDEVHAELLPEDKVAVVESLVERFGIVAMVGDGVNDAPAMARASFGIAMGAGGTDVAIETADIALMSDDLSKLPWLIRHSRRMLAVIHQNIALALTVKALFTILTLFGIASLWGAIAADMGASLVVVFNGLRLLRPPRGERTGGLKM